MAFLRVALSLSLLTLALGTRRALTSESMLQAMASKPMPAPTFDIDQCSSEGRMPPASALPDLPGPEFSAQVIKQMRYALYRPRWRQEGLEHKFEFVEETRLRRVKCLGVFPSLDRYSSAEIPTSSTEETFNRSVGVCILVLLDGENEWPLEYSEYNNDRNIPNFVAFKAIRAEGRTVKGEHCRTHWSPVCPHAAPGTELAALEEKCKGVVDFDYKVGQLDISNCSQSDLACNEHITTRGHMSPVQINSWNRQLCSATMMYLNAFPARQPFDGTQWNKRERMIVEYLQSQGHGASLWVMVGVSRESDGSLASKRLKLDGTPLAYIDVPSFVWTAVFDPKTQQATGWMCRNGLQEFHQCYCADRLSIRDLELRVGHRIFPQLEDKGIDLSSGKHDSLWGHLAGANRTKPRRPKHTST